MSEYLSLFLAKVAFEWIFYILIRFKTFTNSKFDLNRIRTFIISEFDNARILQFTAYLQSLTGHKCGRSQEGGTCMAAPPCAPANEPGNIIFHTISYLYIVDINSNAPKLPKRKENLILEETKFFFGWYLSLKIIFRFIRYMIQKGSVSCMYICRKLKLPIKLQILHIFAVLGLILRLIY